MDFGKGGRLTVNKLIVIVLCVVVLILLTFGVANGMLPGINQMKERAGGVIDDLNFWRGENKGGCYSNSVINSNSNGEKLLRDIGEEGNLNVMISACDGVCNISGGGVGSYRLKDGFLEKSSVDSSWNRVGVIEDGLRLEDARFYRNFYEEAKRFALEAQPLLKKWDEERLDKIIASYGLDSDYKNKFVGVNKCADCGFFSICFEDTCNAISLKIEKSCSHAWFICSDSDSVLMPNNNYFVWKNEAFESIKEDIGNKIVVDGTEYAVDFIFEDGFYFVTFSEYKGKKFALKYAEDAFVNNNPDELLYFWQDDSWVRKEKFGVYTLSEEEFEKIIKDTIVYRYLKEICR